MSEDIEAVRERWWRQMLDMRGVDEPCPKCDGLGTRIYSSTAAWRGGMGGAMMTTAVCDACWGSGDANRHGADLRKLEAARAAWEDEQCIQHFARSTGATFSSTKQHMRVIAELLEHEERRRKTPIGVDAFWWRSTLRMVAAAFRRFAGKDEATP